MKNLVDGMHVFTNLAISMDGKISTKDREHIDASRHDRYLMDVNRSRADAIIMGAGTLRAFQRTATIDRSRLKLARKMKGKKAQPLNVVLARNPDFDPNWPFFTDPFVERLLVVPASLPDRSLKPFQTSSQIFKYEESPDYPEQILRHVASLGCKKILLEGGGGIMFPWVARDLVDEWNITIVPAIMGGESAPTMVEGEGFDVASIKRYKLKRLKRKGSELFLRYVRR